MYEKKEKRVMVYKPITLVVDASVALKWQLKDEPELKPAIAILTDFVNGKCELIAPSLFAYEIVSGILIAILRGWLDEDRGLKAISYNLSLGIQLFDFAPLITRTFRLARTYQRSVYDSAYLALSESEDCDFYTGDRHLYNDLKRRFEKIKWVGDYFISKG